MTQPIQIQKLRKHIGEIFLDCPVGMAYLYGSYAKGTPNENSDVDIALVVTENMSQNKMLKMEMKIGALLDKKFKTCFDIRCINDAPLRVKGEIITSGQLLYCSDEHFRITFETYVRDRYFDFLPALRMMRKVYFTSIKTGGLIG